MASDQDKKKCWERTFDLASKRPEIDQAVAEVLQACTDQGLEEPATFAIRLSLEEAMANAMMHGNGGDETKRIILECQIDSGKVRMTIQDEGPGFDPETVPDPTADENLPVAKDWL